MKYSSVIFDWDGTLAMTLHLWLEAYKSELRNIGYDLPDKIVISDFFYEHGKVAIKYPDIDLDIFNENVQAYLIHHVAQMKLYNEAGVSLERLHKKGIILTLVSSSPRKLLEEVLELTGLSKYFAVIAGFDDVTKHKPDPEPFLNIIEIAKLKPRTTIVIGDSSHDIVAAKSAGVDSCLFLPPENTNFFDFAKLREFNPTYCVDNLKDFADLVLNT